MTEKIVEINKLPDIFQLIGFLKSMENSIMQDSNGWVEYTFNGYKPPCSAGFAIKPRWNIKICNLII